MAALGNQLLQRRARDKLHHQEILTVLLDKIINGDGVGMGKRCCRAGLAAETLYSAEIILVQRAQDLDRYQSLNVMVPCLEDTCHTTRSNVFAYLIASGNQCAFKLCQCRTSISWDIEFVYMRRISLSILTPSIPLMPFSSL